MGGYVGFRPFVVSEDFEYVANGNLLGLRVMLGELEKHLDNPIITNIRKSGCIAKL